MNRKDNELFFNFAYVKAELREHVKESRYGYSIDLDNITYDGNIALVIEKRVRSDVKSRIAYGNSILTAEEKTIKKNPLYAEFAEDLRIESIIEQSEIDSDKWIYYGKRGGNSVPKPKKEPKKQLPEEKKEEKKEKKKNKDMHEVTSIIEQTYNTDVPIALYGPSGTGKTETLIRFFNSKNQEYFLQSLNKETRKSEVYGYYDGHGQYVASPFRQALDKKIPIIFDEADSNPTILLSLNSAISNKILVFPDTTVTIASKLYFTMNTNGTGAQEGYIREMLDLSSRKRLALVHVDYDRELESTLVDSTISSTLWKIRDNINNQGIKNALVTTRDFINVKNLMTAGFTMTQAIDMTIIQGASSAIRDKLLHNVG